MRTAFDAIASIDGAKYDGPRDIFAICRFTMLKAPVRAINISYANRQCPTQSRLLASSHFEYHELEMRSPGQERPVAGRRRCTSLSPMRLPTLPSASRAA